MPKEKLKSVIAIIVAVLVFLISEISDVIFENGFSYLLFLVYPSFAFWITLIATIVALEKQYLNKNIFIKVCKIGIIFAWAASFSMLPVFLPVTAFKAAKSISDIHDFFRLLSVSLFKTGWFLIFIIFIAWYRERTLAP